MLDPRESYLIATDPLTYYRAQTDRDGDVVRLTVDRTVPTKGDHGLEINNDTGSSLDFELRIDLVEPVVSYAEVETPRRVLTESFSLDSGTSVETTAFERLYGTYEVTVVTDESTETATYSERAINVGAITEAGLDMDDRQLSIRVFPPPVRDDIVCSRYWYGDRS